MFFFQSSSDGASAPSSVTSSVPKVRTPIIGRPLRPRSGARGRESEPSRPALHRGPVRRTRSEEHTSELQSQSNLVCRLLLEKKKKHDHTVRPHCSYPPRPSLAVAKPA